MTITRDYAAPQPVVSPQEETPPQTSVAPSAPTGAPAQMQGTGIVRMATPPPPDPAIALEDDWSLSGARDWVWDKWSNFSTGVESFPRGILNFAGQLGDQATSDPAIYDGLPRNLQGLSLGLTQAKELDRYLEASGFWTPPDLDPTLGDKIAQGAGSMAGFMAGGAYANTAKAAMLNSGVLGALVGGGMGVMDAEQYGASEAEQTLTLLGDGLFGATEAFTGGVFLNKINKASGGRLFKTLEQAGLTKTPTLLDRPGYAKEIISGFLTEGAQEGFQTAGENWVAKMIYDPTRPLDQGVWEAAGIGGLLGGVVSGAMVPFQRNQADKQRAELQRVFEEKMKLGGINNFSGPAMSLFNMPELQEEWTQLDEAFKANADDAYGKILAGQFPQVTQALGLSLDATDLDDRRFPEMDEAEVYADVWEAPAEPSRKDKAEVDKLTAAAGRPLTVTELLTETATPVVIAEPKQLEENIKTALAGVSTAQRIYEGARLKLDQKKAAGQQVTKEEKEKLAAIKKQFTLASASLLRVQKRQAATKVLLRQIADYVQKWAEVMDRPAQDFGEGQDPEALDASQQGRWVVVAGTRDNQGVWTNKTLGMARTYVEDPQGEKSEIGMIVLNPNYLLDATHPLNSKQTAIKQKDAGRFYREIRNTLDHELGHLYANKQLDALKSAARLLKSMVDEGQDPDMLPQAEKERAKAYLGILMGYRDHLNKAAGERMLSAVYFLQERGLLKGLSHREATAQAATLANLPPGIKPDLALSQAKTKEWYFSQALQVVEQSPMKSGTGEQWLNFMKKQGVKAEELRWTRVADFLAGVTQGKKISKEELVEYLKINQIKIETAVYGGFKQGVDPAEAERIDLAIQDYERQKTEIENFLRAKYQLVLDYDFWNEEVNVLHNGESLEDHEIWELPAEAQTKLGLYQGAYNAIKALKLERDILEDQANPEVPYQNYQLPGWTQEGSRALTLKIPAMKGLGEYLSHTHPNFVKNMIVWVRFNERTAADGKKVLFIEEIQSDLHQQGLKKGYTKTNLWDTKKEKPKHPWPLRFYADVTPEIQVLEERLGYQHLMASLTGPTFFGARRADFTYIERFNPATVEELLDGLRNAVVYQQEMGYGADSKEKVFLERLNNSPELMETLHQWFDKAKEYSYMWEYREEVDRALQKIEDPTKDIPYGNQPPELPYGDNGYLDIAVKRMIRYAVENGFDSIAWTPAIQQVYRWTSGLRGVIEEISWARNQEETRVGLVQKRGGVINFTFDEKGIVQNASKSQLNGHPLADVVGGPQAARMMAEPKGHIQSANIILGDKGFQESYDRILRDKVNKYVKRWGAKAEKKWLAEREMLEYHLDQLPDNRWRVLRRTLDNSGGEIISVFTSKVEAEELLENLNTPFAQKYYVDGYYDTDLRAMRWSLVVDLSKDGEIVDTEKVATFLTNEEAYAEMYRLQALSPRQAPRTVTPDVAENFSEEWIFDITPEMRTASLAGVPSFERSAAGGGKTVLDLEDKNYWMSFEEYLAHRMERLGARVEMVEGKPVYKSDLDRVMKKHFFSKFSQMYQAQIDAEQMTPLLAQGWSAKDQPYDQFLRRVIVATELDRVMERTLEQGEVSLFDLLKLKGRKIIPGLNPEDFAGLREELDNFNKFQYVALNLIQISRRNPHTFLKGYMEIVANEWSTHGRVMMKRANDTLAAWRKIGKESSNRITNVLMEETLEREPMTPTQLKTRLTPAEAEVYYMVRGDLAYVLEEMQRISTFAAQTTLAGNPEKLAETLKEIETHFSMLRGSGYFPLTRHGNHLLIVRADKDTVIDGKRYKKGDLVHWEGFDYEYERNKAAKEIRAANRDLNISIDQMSDTAYSTQGIPLPMLRLLRSKMEEAGAPGAALNQLDEAIKTALPLNSFHRKFLKRRGIAGFSQDFQRSYAKYMSGAANHMSRVEAGDAMRQQIVKGEEEVRILHELGRDARKRSMMVDWAKSHYQYLMQPANELQGLRSFGFLWYLGFHIKSAVINLTQPLITGYPYMAQRFGDVAAVRHMTLANKDIVSYWKNRTEWTQAAMKEAERKFAYAQQVAEGEFVLDGMSGRFSLDDPQGKFFNLSGLKVMNTNDPEASVKLIEARLKQLKRGVVPDANLQTALESALSAYSAMPGVMATQDFDNLTLEEAMPDLLVDVVVLAGPGGETILRVPHRLMESREIKVSEAFRRREVKDGDIRGELMQMIQRGQAEGWLDQSLAMELAVAASENKVDRLAPIHVAQRAYYKTAEIGSWPFHTAEKLNRLLMAISSYRAAREEGLAPQMAEIEARDCVRLTMYEHTNWNRPMFMRGKKSIFFLFMNYVQNTAYIATQGDSNALRLWLVLALMSGLTGLPFAEDVEDLIDFVGTKLKEQLGSKNPKVQIRQEARQLLEQANLNPDLILHGLGQSTFGVPWVAHHLGFGAPSWDLSSSISMGDIIPGTELPGVLSSRGSDYALSTALREFGGAAVSAGEGALRASVSDDPNEWKKLEKFMPAFARSISKSVRYGVQGGEGSQRGDKIAEFDPFVARDTIELIGQAGGFTPSRVTRGWEQYMAERELVQYYKARGQALTKHFSHAIYVQDREYQADSWRAIQEFNASVPYPEMTIGWTREGKNTLADSVVNYIKAQSEHKLGQGDELKYRRLVDELRAGYKSREVEGSKSTD